MYARLTRHASSTTQASDATVCALTGDAILTFSWAKALSAAATVARASHHASSRGEVLSITAPAAAAASSKRPVNPSAAARTMRACFPPSRVKRGEHGGGDGGRRATSAAPASSTDVATISASRPALINGGGEHVVSACTHRLARDTASLPMPASARRHAKLCASAPLYRCAGHTAFRASDARCRYQSRTSALRRWFIPSHPPFARSLSTRLTMRMRSDS